VIMQDSTNCVHCIRIEPAVDPKRISNFSVLLSTCTTGDHLPPLFRRRRPFFNHEALIGEFQTQYGKHRLDRCAAAKTRMHVMLFREYLAQIDDLLIYALDQRPVLRPPFRDLLVHSPLKWRIPHDDGSLRINALT
jgi:hypothetical protein